MRVRTVVAVLAFALAGCAGSPTLISWLESTGGLRAAPSQSPDYDWLVSLENAKGLAGDYNPDIKEIRNDTVRRYIAARCNAPAIVGETVTEIAPGTTFFGPRLMYEIQVKCEGGKRA
jgi:hypothetical protein